MVFLLLTILQEKGNFDNDGYRNDALTGNVSWSVSHQFTLKGFAQYSDYKTDLDAGAFTDAKRLYQHK